MQSSREIRAGMSKSNGRAALTWKGKRRGTFSSSWTCADRSVSFTSFGSSLSDLNREFIKSGMLYIYSA